MLQFALLKAVLILVLFQLKELAMIKMNWNLLLRSFHLFQCLQQLICCLFLNCLHQSILLKLRLINKLVLLFSLGILINIFINRHRLLWNLLLLMKQMNDILPQLSHNKLFLCQLQMEKYLLIMIHLKNSSSNFLIYALMHQFQLLGCLCFWDCTCVNLQESKLWWLYSWFTWISYGSIAISISHWLNCSHWNIWLDSIQLSLDSQTMALFHQKHLILLSSL